jgi:hypothetical protein
MIRFENAILVILFFSPLASAHMRTCAAFTTADFNRVSGGSLNDAQVAGIASALASYGDTASETDSSQYYNHDGSLPSTTTEDTTDWMREIKGTTMISELSLPGTHDSLSLYGGDAVENQVWTITKQLEAGIRFFDLRF